MENLVIEGTPKTPTIKFEPGDGKLMIKGRSIPENSIEFYKPLVDSLDAYNGNVNVDIVLEYFNTSSSKCILDVFKKLEKIKSDGSDVEIRWHYEEDDEDMLEAGEDYQAIINNPFKMIEIEED